MKQWLDGVKMNLSTGTQCPWPAMEKEQIYENLHELLFCVVWNWQDCQEEEVSIAALPAQDGSRKTHVSSSVCAQQAESRGVMRGSGLALQRALNWLCAGKQTHVAALWQEVLGMRLWGKPACPPERAHLLLSVRVWGRGRESPLCRKGRPSVFDAQPLPFLSRTNRPSLGLWLPCWMFSCKRSCTESTSGSSSFGLCAHVRRSKTPAGWPR